MPSFLNNPSLGPKVASILDSHGDKIHDDSFLKIIRQLEFWYPHLVLANEGNDNDDDENEDNIEDDNNEGAAVMMAKIMKSPELKK